MKSPTEKMIALAEKIAYKLDLPMPDTRDYQIVKEFIDLWIEDYKYYCK